jgi:UDP-glucuronate decarboxylase
MQKTILITGCAGFIGTNLVIRLLSDRKDGEENGDNQNIKIIGLDNLLTSLHPSTTLDAKYFDRYEFIHCDIVKDLHILSTLPKIDEIYHLASVASPPKYRKYPIETMDVNIIGTKNILDVAVKNGAKFILTSTSEVYGDPLEHPQKESYYGNVNTVGERSCYDESKRCAETYVYEYRQKYGTNFKICRIFNTYGPHMDIDDGRVVTNIIKHAIHNRPVFICGDGKQTRSFCYIDDLLDGLVALMASREAGPVNLGNPDTECSINQLVAIFEKIVGGKLVVTRVPKMENDPLVRKPDITKAQILLDFSPKIGLEEGMQKTFDHFVARKNI